MPESDSRSTSSPAPAAAEADASVAGSTPNSGAGLSPATDNGTQQSGREPADQSSLTRSGAPGGVAKDRDAEILARLDKGEPVSSVRQNPDPVDPPDGAEPGRDTPRQQTGQPQPNAAQDKTKSKPQGAVEGSENLDYDGVDAKAVDALRRAQLLPDQDAWAEMGVKTRASLVATARRVLQTQGRLSQQLGQTRQNQNQAQTATEIDEGEYDEAADPGTGQAPPSFAPQAQRGVSYRAPGQAQFPGQNPPAQQQQQPNQPPPLDQLLAPVATYFGDEVAGPIRQAFEQQQQALQQQQEWAIQQQQESEQRAAQTEGLARQVFLPQEREALKDLADQAGRELQPQERQHVLSQAVLFYRAACEADEQITWKDAIGLAGQAAFQGDIQQQAQKQLLDRRRDSLSRSPARGASRTPAPKPQTSAQARQEDRDTLADRMLAEGKTVAQVRTALAEL